MSNSPEIKINVKLNAKEAQKDVQKISPPLDGWDKYKKKVFEAENAVRRLYSGTFKDAKEIDAAINDIGDKLDDLTAEGYEFEKTFKKIGFTPEQKESFESITSVLNKANRQYEKAIDNREKLLRPLVVPEKPIVEKFPWEVGPEAEHFSKKVKEIDDALVSYSSQLNDAKVKNDELRKTLTVAYSSLDKNSLAYKDQKKIIESTMRKVDSFSKSVEKQQKELRKHSKELTQAYNSGIDTGDYAKNLQKVKALSEALSSAGVAVNKTLREQAVLSGDYQSNMTVALEKASVEEARFNEQLKLQSLTLKELIVLQRQLVASRATATSQDALKAIDYRLASVNKQIHLVGRASSTNAAQIIGSQRSVRGAFSSTINLWGKGRLILGDLVDGVKLFAKSTIVLAAIQLAWELLTNVWEKARTALFGTADASEKAAEKQKELAEAAREANKALIAAQDALLMANKDGGKTVEEVIKAQNEAYKEQIELIDKATAAHLRQSAITAKEGEQAVALERLDLQEKLMLGIIDEFEYKEKIIDLDLKAKEQQSKAALEKKEIEQADAEKKAAQAKKELKDAENLQKQYELAPEKLRVKVDSYKAWKADLDETKGKISELESERSKLELALKGLNAIGGEYGAPGTRWATKVTKEKLKENDFKLRSLRFDYSTQEQNMLQVYKDIPQFIRQMGMSNESISKYNSEYQKASEQYKTAQAAYNQAQKKADELEEQYNNATEDELRNAEMRQEIADKQKKHLAINKENQKKNEANEKKAQALRNKVNSMTYQELKAEEKALLDKVSKAGKDSPEGKRWKALADVYSSERRSRDAESRKAREKVEWTGRDATGEAARIVDNAAKLAGKSVRNDAVDLVALAQLVKQAADTKSLADDAALKQTLKTVESLITTTQASSQKMRNLEKQVARLNRKTAAQL